MQNGTSPIAVSTKAHPTVGCPANGSSLPGVKMRQPARATRGFRRQNEHCLERFISRVIACIVSVSRGQSPIGEDGELVPAKHPVGEDVSGDKSITLRHARSLHVGANDEVSRDPLTYMLCTYTSPGVRRLPGQDQSPGRSLL